MICPCKKCGKEVQEGWSICPNCGEKLVEEPGVQEKPKTKKKKKPIGKIIIALIVIIGIFAVMSGGGDSDNTTDKETIEKLQKFTTMTKDGDTYIFSNGEDWELHYTTENEFVEITEPEVLDCFTSAFDSSDIGNSGTFGYDLDENEARMYFDYYSKADNKDLSIINYDIDKDEYTALADGDHYEISKDLQDYLDEYKLSDIIKTDVESFKEDLENQGLTFDDVKNLKYDDIVSYEK